MKTERILYVVETPEGFLGCKPHSCLPAKSNASFAGARLFSSFKVAERNAKVAPGWFVHRLYLKVEPKN